MHEHERINKFLPLMRSLYEAAKEKLGFKPHVKIVIMKNDENMMNPLGKTAHYSPGEHKIGLYTQGRHIKDILRSLSHELVHHNQNCRGDFDNGAATIQGYAQEDGHLREMEREAYECGNMIFRDWEDKMKEKGVKPLFTSTNQYVPPPTSDVVGMPLIREKNMKNKVNESQLRNIIRGVIQEMFNDDLNEAGIADGPAKYEKKEEGLKVAPQSDEGVASASLDEDKEELEETKDENLDEDKEELEETKDETLEEEEEVNETFLPKNRSIREKARIELNEALMKRWSKVIK